eukprot:GEMP01033906.1.p1 GENE.GEMP01033906.1~~GEMP01033906.1.p1  ORF type:complete len:410 (+),score=76.14 GEMP01033906.1:52-1281(+)
MESQGGTCYQLLELEPTCTDEEIKNQYRKLALKLHPDKNRSDPNATTRFQELQAAYEILGDTEKRKTYDENSDFIHRAFSDNDYAGESILAVPSKRVFWVLMAEAAFNDDAKNLIDFAGNLSADVLDELLSGGVCGFTLLHMAAFAGKPKACKTLIELGAPVNAKTQPLFATASQQFMRPTPLDVTILITQKKQREQTIKVLLANDATECGVNFSTIPVGQQLVKHQFILLRDEILGFTRHISTSLRRILRTEPRWREIIIFPGEDAKQMERQRTMHNLTLVWARFKWMILGGKEENQWYVWAGNAFAAIMAGCLFNFRAADVLAIALVSGIFMLFVVVARKVTRATVLSDDFDGEEAVRRTLEWWDTYWDYIHTIRSWILSDGVPVEENGAPQRTSKASKPKGRRTRR